MNEIYREVCENLNWSVTVCEDGTVELETTSPAGEDLIVTVEAENFVDNVKAYAASFDKDERIEMWILARRSGTSGVPSAKELVEDAQAIDDMLRELSCALFAAELEAVGA